jgi:hypothetical protein
MVRQAVVIRKRDKVTPLLPDGDISDHALIPVLVDLSR